MSENVSAPVRYHDMGDVVNPKYDKIVDRSDFKRGQDKERAMRLTGDTGGSPTSGVYDFQEGHKGREPTDVELALRSGRLDKADIDTLKRIATKSATEEAENKLSEKEKAQKDAIENARQAFIDEKTGFDSSSVKSDS